jgi:hypothetical protein
MSDDEFGDYDDYTRELAAELIVSEGLDSIEEAMASGGADAAANNVTGWTPRDVWIMQNTAFPDSLSDRGLSTEGHGWGQLTSMFAAYALSEDILNAISIYEEREIFDLREVFRCGSCDKVVPRKERHPDPDGEEVEDPTWDEDDWEERYPYCFSCAIRRASRCPCPPNEMPDPAKMNPESKVRRIPTAHPRRMYAVFLGTGPYAVSISANEYITSESPHSYAARAQATWERQNRRCSVANRTRRGSISARFVRGTRSYLGESDAG